MYNFCYKAKINLSINKFRLKSFYDRAFAKAVILNKFLSLYRIAGRLNYFTILYVKLSISQTHYDYIITFVLKFSSESNFFKAKFQL